MTQSFPAVRMRRSAVALAVVALLGGSLVVPTAAFAEPGAVEVPTASLVTTGTTWKYLDDYTDPAGENENRQVWAAADFDDSGWKQAPSAFGVKNNALAPVGPYTPVTKLEHYIDGVATPTIPTYFFRTTFDIPEGVSEQLASAASTIVYDDAVRVYVNGERVANFRDGRVDDANPSNQQYAGENGGNPVSGTFSIDGELLRDGENTIAVALYQDRASSSDAYFDMTELTLVKASVPGEVVEAAPTRVILTPTETPATSQSFSWLAGDVSHGIGQVEIVPAAGGDTRAVDAYETGRVNGNQTPHFSATVDGLAPATAYRYRVGLPGSWSEWYEFTTADPAATDFQFVYYGDAQIGLDTTWPEVVRQAEERATRSIGSVHAGDLIDTGSNDTQWRNWFKGMEKSATSTNVMAAPGNHEYSGDKLLASWKAHFEYPLNQPSTETIGELAALAQGDSDAAKQYAAYFAHWAEFAAETVYFTDYQGVRFITLNATRDTEFLRPSSLPSCSGAECPSGKVAALWTEYQAAWLDYVLKNSASKWNVVTFHQPVYSTSSGRNEPVLREYWVPVFEENNIDLVLMGHDHTYARGYKNTTSTDTEGMTTGPVYAVSNSGAKHYDLETEAKNVWTNNGATQVLRGEKVTTYQVIDVSADQLVYRSYVAENASGAKTYAYVDGAYVERPAKNVGDLYDEVIVTKYSDGKKWVTEPGVEIPAGPADPVDPVDPVDPKPTDPDPKVSFTDVQKGDKFSKEIAWMAAEGISTGVKQANGTYQYQPKNRVTREAMAAFLYRLSAPKDFKAPATSPFADVQPGDKFYKEIAWMHQEGVSTGTRQASGKPQFQPKSGITREAMAAFMYRLDATKKPAVPAVSPFADVRKGDKFYKEIAWMSQSGLSTGIKQSSGKPAYAAKSNVTREAMAAFLYRAES
ncbi:fibronectin type III domain-containing protein [Leucobacter celer]|uniref:fibronectin type III domain-containing protein n=1 Tax=Leucobacter celer TaxID=668625 RepID=UPI0006A7C2C1|nr:fibronectin type III domain-containing protein [Leucobacter celer]